MRKKNLLLGMVFVVVLGIAGCGQQEASVTRVEAERAYEMEAESPQNETKAAEEAQKNAQLEAEEQAALEAQENAQQAAKQAAQEAQVSNSTENLLSEEEALNIVLNKVPGAVKTDVRMQLEMDDGHWVYEGEVIYDLKEYEFELSAENGTIMEWSVESVYD